MDPLSISVAELRSATTRLLNDIEQRFGPELTLSADFYWNVPLNEVTQLHRRPRPDVGSVVDDVASVREYLARDPTDAPSIWHQADHLVGVLREIARLDLAR